MYLQGWVSFQVLVPDTTASHLHFHSFYTALLAVVLSFICIDNPPQCIVEKK